jgi:hypothetical protein
MAESLVKKKRKYPREPVRYLAKMVHDLTGGGTALIEFMFEVLTNEVPGATVRDRLDAARYLTERGYGKSPQVVQIQGGIQHTVTGRYDLAKLSDEELAQIAGSLEKAQRGLPSPEQPLNSIEEAVIDVTPLPDAEFGGVEGDGVPDGEEK